MRSLLWRCVWGLLFRIWATLFVVEGEVPDGTVVFTPNHSSHADTAALQLALARAGHRKVMAAGAEDYFFTNVITGAFSRLIGVFPFPRSGCVGIERARALLIGGTSVILYPQGTRNGGPFRSGIAHLARDQFEVVPVTIRGTDLMLPKGATWPRRSPIHIQFGTPMAENPGESPAEFAARLEKAVVGDAPIDRAA